MAAWTSIRLGWALRAAGREVRTEHVAVAGDRRELRAARPTSARAAVQVGDHDHLAQQPADRRFELGGAVDHVDRASGRSGRAASGRARAVVGPSPG